MTNFDALVCVFVTLAYFAGLLWLYWPPNFLQ